MVRKFGIVIIVILASVVALNAQAPVGQGGKQLNFGGGFSDSGIPLYIGLDYGVHPDITIGGEASFWADDNYGGFGFSANGNYHFNTVLDMPSEWNFYAGANVGFHSGHNHFGLGLQVGGRYFFNNKWGINLELGGGSNLSGGKIGATCRF